jgi:uncharacterized protein (TIGR03067 family)
MPRYVSLASVAVFVLTSAIASGEPAKAEDARAADLKALQGKWKVTKAVKQGDEEKGDDKVELVIADSTAKLFDHGKHVMTWKLAINPATSPKEIDVTVHDEVEKDEKDVTTPGIYQLKDGRLTLCIGIAEATKERPKTFDAGRKVLLMELEKLAK